MLSEVLGVFFPSKSAVFLHVASDSIEKHCTAFFLPVSTYFERKSVGQPLHFFC